MLSDGFILPKNPDESRSKRPACRIIRRIDRRTDFARFRSFVFIKAMGCTGVSYALLAPAFLRWSTLMRFF
jgi:hypothetical protein